MACPVGPFVWTPLNLTEKYPGYRILDRNTAEYQMEAFMYTCVILLFYTVATGAFMVKFILQGREPWESVDSDSTGAASGLPMVVKLREQERHRKLVERQARRDVKMQMINHLRQMSMSGASLERRTSAGSIETQMTSFSSDQKGISGNRRPSMSGANLSPHRALIKSNSNTARFVLPLSHRDALVERTFSEANSSVCQSPIYPCAYQPLTRVCSSLRYQHRQSNDTLDDTLVSL